MSLTLSLLALAALLFIMNSLGIYWAAKLANAPELYLGEIAVITLFGHGILWGLVKLATMTEQNNLISTLWMGFVTIAVMLSLLIWRLEIRDIQDRLVFVGMSVSLTVFLWVGVSWLF